MQLIRFLLVGVLNTGIGLSCIFTAMWLFELDYRLANIIGYFIGCSIGFVLNRLWTFRHQGSWWGSLIAWLAVVAASYSLNFLVIIALHYGLMVNAYAAQLGGIVTYTVATFVGCRYVAFRDLVSVPVMREGAA